MDIRSFPKAFILDFIALYKSFPCLWKIGSKEYADRDLKNIAYEQLVKKLQERMPNANKESVLKKLDSMRGSFRKEFKKLAESIECGVSAEEVYKPRLWYFKNLLFLKDNELPRLTGISKTEQDDSLSQESQEQPFVHQPSSSENVLDFRLGTSKRKSKSSSKGAKKTKIRDIVLRKVNETLDMANREDDFDTFAKYLATRLRRLPMEVEPSTERLILDLVFQAELGHVDNHTRLQLFKAGTSEQSTVSTCIVHAAPVATESNDQSVRHIGQTPFFFGDSVSATSPAGFELLQNVSSDVRQLLKQEQPD